MKRKRGYYDVFVQTCAKYPSNVGVRLYDNGIYKNYTYSELYGICEYISQNIQMLKQNKGVIGLVSKINILIPCVIAAVHKFYTTFMFMNTYYDIESLSNDIDFTIIIAIETANVTPEELFGKKPDNTIPIFDLNVHFYSLNPTKRPKSPRSSRSPRSMLEMEHSFIAMTSGSTGSPKHIQVPVQCLQPNIDDLTKMFNITQNDIIYLSTPLTFDPSMVDILLACSNGASLLIAHDEADILFPPNGENSITVWQTTPSKFFQYSNDDIQNKILAKNSTLKILALGGESLSSIKRLKELKDPDNITKVFTLYGVTEMSCWACVTELDLNKITDDMEIPLGNCLSETQLLIDKGKENTNKGNIVLVSKTRKCTILNKRRGIGSMLHFVDTGDIGEVKNGTVYYRGRKDDIIKRFGNKVNLQTIEMTVMQCPRVKTCSCIWLPKPMLLVLYYSSETFTTQELSDFLKCKLNDKHWPDKIMRVHNLPTNFHGKKSKLTISKMFKQVIDIPQNIDALTAMLLQELKTTLNLNFQYNDIKDKNFFALGGTSFLAVILGNRLSIKCPELGNIVLPYLISEKYSIDQIIKLAHEEMCLKPKKSNHNMKRMRTEEDYTEFSPKKKDCCKLGVEFKTNWTYDTGKCVDASPTLFMTDFKLCVAVGSHSGKVVVLDAASGALQGEIILNSRIEASVLCFQDHPARTPCGVVGAYDGTIVCFTLDTCKQIWRINIKSMVKSKGVVLNELLYLAAYDGNVRCIDISTGVIIKTMKISELAISADLVVAKGEYVLLGGLSGAIVSIYARNNAIAWRHKLSSPVFANPVVYDADRYGLFAEVNGTIHCRSIVNGTKIWKYQGAGGNIFSSLCITKSPNKNWLMIFGCHDENVYCVNISKSPPSLVWKTCLTSPVFCTPCCLNEKCILAVSNNGNLSVIDQEQGIIVNELNLPGETFSTPSVQASHIFIGCRNDHVYSIKYVTKV